MPKGGTMATERIISADSHVNPPKDLWTRDAPERLASSGCAASTSTRTPTNASPADVRRRFGITRPEE